MSILGKDINQLTRTTLMVDDDLMVLEKRDGTKSIKVKDVKYFLTTTGPQGPMGPQGPQGMMGQTGPAGAAPVIGTNSNWYINGLDSGKPSRGEKGDTGPAGPQGQPGSQGLRGDDGRSLVILGELSDESKLPAPGPSIILGSAYTVKGFLFVYNGSSWINAGAITGPKGDKGDAGPTGAMGPVGATGPAGPQGTIGATGPQGEVGPKGDTGPQGPQGPTGPAPSIDPDTHTWVVDGVHTTYSAVGEKGDKGETGPQGPQGETGERGERGLSGLSPVINATTGHWWVGALDTGVKATGPMGPPGVKGETGEPGVQGLPGMPGQTGPAGPEGPAGTSFTIRDTVPTEADLPTSVNEGDAYVTEDTDDVFYWNGTKWLNLGSIHGPKGDQGDEGPVGPAGPTGPEGPQGIQGKRGLQGLTGATGPEGPMPDMTIYDDAIVRLDSEISSMSTNIANKADIASVYDKPHIDTSFSQVADELVAVELVVASATTSILDNARRLDALEAGGTPGVDANVDLTEVVNAREDVKSVTHASLKARIDTDVNRLENAKLDKTGGTVSGNLTVTGNSVLGNTASKSIAPVSNNVYDLGLVTNRWNNIYSNNANFSGTIVANTVTADNLYNKDYINSLQQFLSAEIDEKADAASVYTKAEIDTIESDLTDLISSANSGSTGNYIPITGGEVAGDLKPDDNYNGRSLGNQTDRRWKYINGIYGNFSESISAKNISLNRDIYCQNTSLGILNTYSGGTTSNVAGLTIDFSHKEFVTNNAGWNLGTYNSRWNKIYAVTGDFSGDVTANNLYTKAEVDNLIANAGGSGGGSVDTSNFLHITGGTITGALTVQGALNANSSINMDAFLSATVKSALTVSGNDLILGNPNLGNVIIQGNASGAAPKYRQGPTSYDILHTGNCYSKAQMDSTFIKATNNENWSTMIRQTDWAINPTGGYKKMVAHNLNSTNVIVFTINLDTNKVSQLACEVVDFNHVVLESPTNNSTKVIISAKYYAPLLTGTYDNEIVDARKGEANLKAKIDKLEEAIAAGGSSGPKLWTGSQAAYDAITTKDPNTLYFVEE